MQVKIEPSIASAAADASGVAGPSSVNNTFLPEWPPAGSLGSGHLMGSAGAGHMMMGISPGMMGDVGAFGKSLDMIDVCSQLMQGGKICISGCPLMPHDEIYMSQCTVLMYSDDHAVGLDPLSNLGSLKNDLLLPPNFKPNNPDDDDLEDDLMLLGTTPNVGSAGIMSSSALRAGAAARATHAAFGRESTAVHHDLLPRCIDEEDELMGMSPDMPSMMRSPAGVAGFSEFMKQGIGHQASQSSLAAAAAASNEQVPTMVGAFSAQDA